MEGGISRLLFCGAGHPVEIKRTKVLTGAENMI